jgi:hypothetical protein
MEKEDGSHQDGSKQCRIPVVINGHVDPSQRKCKRSLNCDSASSIQRIFDKSATIKDVRKVVIFGDSHSRGLSAKLSAKLSNRYEVIGYTKPNCDMQTLLSMENQDIINLTKMDVLVLIMGMNDVTSDKCSKDLWHISQFVEQNIRTNIILMTKPLRYDQVTNVYINNEIMKFNRKLGKYMKLSDHVTILESPQDRVLFTRHGLHYSGFGKETICNQLAMSIGNLFQYTEVSPISLGWEGKPPTPLENMAPITGNEASNSVAKIVDSSTMSVYNTHMRSTRQRKLPFNRTDDFLWQF